MKMPKKAMLIAAAWDSNDYVMKAIKEEYQRIVSSFGWEDIGMIFGEGCGTPSMTQNTKFMEKVYKLGFGVE